MATLIPENFETVAPSQADAQLARESSRLLAAHELGRRASVRIRLLDGGDETETVVVPTSAVRLFLHLLTEMSQGNADHRLRLVAAIEQPDSDARTSPELVRGKRRL